MSNLPHDEKFIYDRCIKYSEHSIIFQDNFDILLNRGSIPYVDKAEMDTDWVDKSKLEQQGLCIFPTDELKIPKGKKVFAGGLIIPVDKEVGSGNIVISGDPGTGKSTLVFQMAATCRNEINKGIAIYYSLELTRETAVASFVNQGRKTEINLLEKYLPTREESNERNEWFEKCLLNGSDKIIPQIVMPLLSARSLKSEDAKNLYETRYQELEMMLEAASEYNKTIDEKAKQEPKAEQKPKVKLFAFDGLNMFGEKPLSREELYRLFDLFSKYRFISVFALEDCMAMDEDRNDYIKNIKFRADVVINLSTSHFHSHYETYIEVTKSRNVIQLPGKHPYKITEIKDKNKKTKDDKEFLRKKLDVFLSLHYLVSAVKDLNSERNVEGYKPVENNIFGIKIIDKVLPEYFKSIDISHPQIISLTGKSGLYKSDLAVNALLYGMFEGIKEKDKDKGENALIIRLSDRDSFEVDGVRLCNEVFNVIPKENILPNNSIDDNILNNILTKKYILPKIHKIVLSKTDDQKVRLGRFSAYKCGLKGWKIGEKELYELTFKSGALMPEEFFEVVYNVIRDYQIGRIAFLGLKLIGVSYPFLCDSETSGKLFLSALEQIARKHKIHLIVSAPDVDVEASKVEINKMIELSDTKIDLSLSMDKSEVYLTGGGNQIASEDASEKYIIKKIEEESQFVIDNKDTPKLKLFEIVCKTI